MISLMIIHNISLGMGYDEAETFYKYVNDAVMMQKSRYTWDVQHLWSYPLL